MLCAVPVGRLPAGTVFLFKIEGGIEAGAVIRPGWGYTQVVYSRGKKHNEFIDRKGELQEFDAYGFRKEEWSSGTLVRPLSEDDMAEQAETALVADSPAPSTADIKDKVAKLKARAAAAPKAASKASAKAPAGKAPKAAREPKVREQNPCTCGCGGTTGGRFCPGHDARYYGWLKKITTGDMEFKALPKSVQKALVDVKGVKRALSEHGSK